LTTDERRELEGLARRHKTGQQLAERARIVLRATTAWRWARKSASVRVGPACGASTRPVAMSRLRMNERVP
jgi:hypothetical protein